MRDIQINQSQRIKQLQSMRIFIMDPRMCFNNVASDTDEKKRRKEKKKHKKHNKDR